MVRALSARQHCICFAILLLPLVTWAAFSPTSVRFTASYMRKMSIDAELLPLAAEKVVWSDFSNFLEKINSQASTGHYEEFAFGTADIDTLDSLFRFNVTYTNFSKGGVGVANSKTRATTLLMYDVVLGEYNSTKLYRAGTNFTWTSPSCSCNLISETSGGSPPLLSLPQNAVLDGPVSITVNKKSIQSVKWNYQSIGFLPGDQPVAVDMTYSFYVSTTSPGFLDRVVYSFKLTTSATVTVQFDFWQPATMVSSYMMVPDTSCSRTCYNSAAMSLRVQPANSYPSTCEHTPDTLCTCIMIANLTHRPFCEVPWAISSDIDFEQTDKYAMHIKNLSVDAQPTSIPKECAQQMSDFICRFYFPPCQPMGAKFRPPINGTLQCWEENPKYFNSQGGSSTTTENDALLGQFFAAVGGTMPDYPKNNLGLQNTLELAEILEPDGEPTTEIPIAIPTVETPESRSSPLQEPSTTPYYLAPSNAGPEHPPSVPSTPQTPVAPSYMTPDSINLATSYSTFSSYNVIAKVSITYPDILTLKNWQIALLLFGTLALLLTIAISIIMANRRVVNHFEKI